MAKRKETLDDLEFSQDVLWVYRHLAYVQLDKGHEGVTKQRKELWQWASTSGNREKFLTAMVPKAEEALRKHNATNDSEKAVKVERKTIAELKHRLDISLEEAQKDEDSSERSDVYPF